MRYLLILLAPFSLFCLEYTHLETPNDSYFNYFLDPQSIHIIEVDPAKFQIKPVKAFDNGLGREPVSSIAARHQALAAINGGFFAAGSTNEGRACGALKIKDWLALPYKPRGAIGWSANHPPLFDRLLVEIKCNGAPITGLNRSRKEGEAILFTPLFHKTTLTLADGEELIIVDNTVQSVQKSGSSPIPSNGYVLSIHRSHPFYETFSEGDPISFSFIPQPQTKATTSDQWDNVDFVVGGAPLLVHNKELITDFSSEQTVEKFLFWRHARTAIGLLPNGHWLLVVVDKSGIFDGMTIPELAQLMLTLGCVEALNLDGGSSSTMIYENTLKNTPDEGELGVGDALLILP